MRNNKYIKSEIIRLVEGQDHLMRVKDIITYDLKKSLLKYLVPNAIKFEEGDPFTRYTFALNIPKAEEPIAQGTEDEVYAAFNSEFGSGYNTEGKSLRIAYQVKDMGEKMLVIVNYTQTLDI